MDIRPLGDFHFDVLAWLGTMLAARLDQHFVIDLGIVCGYIGNTVFTVITSHQHFMGALEHLDDGTLATAPSIYPGHATEHLVAIEYQTHLSRAQKQIIATRLGHQKAKAITMALDAPLDQVELVYRSVGTAAGVDQLAVTLHGAQPATQGLDAFFAVDPQFILQLGTRGGRAAVFEQLEDQLATGNGIFVFLGFAGRFWIDCGPVD